MQYLVDTESSASIIAEDTYIKHFEASMALSTPSVTLLDYSNGQIVVKGCFLKNVVYRHRSTSVLFYIVQHRTTGLGLD